MGDVKGLYKKADDNPDFKMTGVHKDAPYEPPKDPEIHIDGGSLTVDQSVHVILDYLTEKGFLPSEPEDEEVGAKSIEEAGSESAEEVDASDSAKSTEEVHASDSESSEEVDTSDSESVEEVHASDSESAEEEVARTVTKKTSFPSRSSTKKAVFNVSTKNTVKDDDEESADDSA